MLAANGADECAICGERVARSADTWRCGTCSFGCHAGCARQWFARSASCPQCRAASALKQRVLADAQAETAPPAPAAVSSQADALRLFLTLCLLDPPPPPVYLEDVD